MLYTSGGLFTICDSAPVPFVGGKEANALIFWVVCLSGFVWCALRATVYLLSAIAHQFLLLAQKEPKAPFCTQVLSGPVLRGPDAENLKIRPEFLPMVWVSCVVVILLWLGYALLMWIVCVDCEHYSPPSCHKLSMSYPESGFWDRSSIFKCQFREFFFFISLFFKNPVTRNKTAI